MSEPVATAASSSWPAVGHAASALREAVELADGRLAATDLAAAREVLTRVDERGRLSSAYTVVALGGGTGSGKSALFNALVGLDLSLVAARRPATTVPVACVWGDPADEAVRPLLDRLNVTERNRLRQATALDPRPDEALSGLVLVDLPDHDSVRDEHRALVDHVVERADLIVWVVDPQKYADAALHERYLSLWRAHAGATAVVVNQIDRVSSGDRDRLVGDVARLVGEDGLAGVPVLATSATERWGIDRLRALLGERVSAHRAAAVRLHADVVAAAVTLGARAGQLSATSHDAEVQALHDRLAAAAAVATVEGSGQPTAASGEVVPSLPHVTDAVARYVTAVSAGLPPSWRAYLSSPRTGVDPRVVVRGLAEAVGGVRPEELGPRGLRRLLMTSARADDERKAAVEVALARAVADVAQRLVVVPVDAELARHRETILALATAATPDKQAAPSA